MAVEYTEYNTKTGDGYGEWIANDGTIHKSPDELAKYEMKQQKFREIQEAKEGKE